MPRHSSASPPWSLSSSAEAATTTAFQLGVLQHLETFAGIVAPRPVSTLSGDACGHIEDAGTRYRLRLLTWVEGEQLAARGIDAALAGGATHVGFIFFEKSPRNIAIDEAAALAALKAPTR